MRPLLMVLNLEIRKHLSYRVDFWVDFLGNTFGQLAIAYALWAAVFMASGSGELGGYTLHGMVYYSLLAQGMMKIISGHSYGNLAADIYDGSLNRYLIYPVGFLQYKFASHLSVAFIAAGQVWVTRMLFVWIFGLPEGIQTGLLEFVAALGFALLGSVFYFLASAVIELLAFWADNIWSLMVMLRLTTLMLGGVYLPLSLFPDWTRGPLEWLPFAHLVSLPVRIALGSAATSEILLGAAVLMSWSLSAALLYRMIWRRGMLQYSGVGI